MVDEPLTEKDIILGDLTRRQMQYVHIKELKSAKRLLKQEIYNKYDNTNYETIVEELLEEIDACFQIDDGKE